MAVVVAVSRAGFPAVRVALISHLVSCLLLEELATSCEQVMSRKLLNPRLMTCPNWFRRREVGGLGSGLLRLVVAPNAGQNRDPVLVEGGLFSAATFIVREGLSRAHLQRMGVDMEYRVASALAAMTQHSSREKQGVFSSDGRWGQMAGSSKVDEWGTGGGVAGLQVDPTLKQSSDRIWPQAQTPTVVLMIGRLLDQPENHHCYDLRCLAINVDALTTRARPSFGEHKYTETLLGLDHISYRQDQSGTDSDDDEEPTSAAHNVHAGTWTRGGDCGGRTLACEGAGRSLGCPLAMGGGAVAGVAGLQDEESSEEGKVPHTL